MDEEDAEEDAGLTWAEVDEDEDEEDDEELLAWCEEGWPACGDVAV